MTHAPADQLYSRTYIGLVLSQFLAAFNDQATHFVAIFFCGDMLVRFVGFGGLDEKAVISLVTACFVSPFFLFSPLAGILADKFSKRSILVFWKLAEIGIMTLVLAAFLMPHLAAWGWFAHRDMAIGASFVLIVAVFLMGMHSAFFVPAKYGVMPEILKPSVLSRGNGLLEGTSFLANILGTCFGGFMYGWLKGSFNVTTGTLAPKGEWVIGAALLALAVTGAIAAQWMARTPPAAPDRKIVWQPWEPLLKNLRVVGRSRQLTLAVLGIAFFSFMTLFLRQSLIFEGEASEAYKEARKSAEQQSAKRSPLASHEGVPETVLVGEGASGTQRAEFRVTWLISLVGLGVGLGSSLAGRLSGSRVELGLVPIGAALIALTAGALAWAIQFDGWTSVCLVIVGASAGLYIVPLYTLLQHRAPKDSKGNLVATSNFLNVAGGLLAIVTFYFLTFGLEWSLGIDLRPFKDESMATSPAYLQQLEIKAHIPRVLFSAACLFTLGMLVLLRRQLPDFFLRSLWWMRSYRRYHLNINGLHHVPSQGPVIVASNCRRFTDLMCLLTTIDRYTRYILFEDGTESSRWPLLRWTARKTGQIVVRDGAALARGATPAAAGSGAYAVANGQPPWEQIIAAGIVTLGAKNMVGVTGLSSSVADPGDEADARGVELLNELARHAPAPILPVFCFGDAFDGGRVGEHRQVLIIVGAPLPAGASAEDVRAAIQQLRHD